MKFVVGVVVNMKNSARSPNKGIRLGRQGNIAAGREFLA